MCISVYKMPPKAPSFASNSLICHLRELTIAQAIEKLSKAGVFAIPGPDLASIVLVGYHREAADLLQDFRTVGHAVRPHSFEYLGRIRKLSLTA